MRQSLVGRLADTLLLTYRTPAASVAPLLPAGLELATRGPWAFWSVVCCRVERMRPGGLPRMAGVSFHHVAYRLRVKAMTSSAEIIEGLYFTHSDADGPLPTLFDAVGNRLTDLRLHRATIDMHRGDDAVRVSVGGGTMATQRSGSAPSPSEGEGRGEGRRPDPQARMNQPAAPDPPPIPLPPSREGGREARRGYRLRLEVAHAPAALLAGSCFPTVEDARAFGRYPPAALSVREGTGGTARRELRVMRVERMDSAWVETPVAVRTAEVGYFDALGQSGLAELEWAVRLRPMDYRWVLGERRGLLGSPDAAFSARRAASGVSRATA